MENIVCTHTHTHTHKKWSLFAHDVSAAGSKGIFKQVAVSFENFSHKIKERAILIYVSVFINYYTNQSHRDIIGNHGPASNAYNI